MTRINVGIDPSELPRKLLLSEFREITRIPNNIKKGKVIFEGIPDTFKLGKGHVKFFYNKLLFIKNRYVQLYIECKRRNFNVVDKISSFDDLPQNLLNDYEPTDYDREIVVERIKNRGFSLQT